MSRPGATFIVLFSSALLLLPLTGRCAEGSPGETVAVCCDGMVLDGSASSALYTDCEELPPLLGDSFRYGQTNVVFRILLDLPAIPGAASLWSTEDWLTFGALAAGVGVLMLPTSPSPDARIQDWVRGSRTSDLDGVFIRIISEKLAAGALTLLASTAIYGYGFEQPRILEWSSLMAEAMAVSQLYHLAAKMLIGREGPKQGSHRGLVFGPAGAVDFFPSGTPSGHSATVCSAAAVTNSYFGLGAASLIGHGACAFIAASLVYNDQHFISDVIWGAPMGYFIGRWVVRHRSSRYRYAERRALEQADSRVTVLPFVPAGQGPAPGATLRIDW